MNTSLELSRRMEGAIPAGALRSFVELAKTDHLRFKSGIYQVPWYCHGEGRDGFSRLSGYREMEKPHTAVHEHGVQAPHRYHAGDVRGALHELKGLEMASRDVLAALERMATAGEGDHNLLCHSAEACGRLNTVPVAAVVWLFGSGVVSGRRSGCHEKGCRGAP